MHRVIVWVCTIAKICYPLLDFAEQSGLGSKAQRG